MPFRDKNNSLYIAKLGEVMYSSFYRYISMYPTKKCNDLPTETIRNVFKSQRIFVEKLKGSFTNVHHISTYIEVQLLDIFDHNNWSSEDFNPKKTNYIAVVITRNEDDEERIMSLFIKIAKELQWILFEEDDEEGVILYLPDSQAN